ncbi:MAG TPA: hypothetical protein VEV44_11895, partial [Pseudoneobacillus sp.]|nr:hypothetical protein [Pseudoneobacillus sp.]
VTAATFLIFFILPVGNAASQFIWQSKVPLNIQGRVFALRRMIAMSLSPIAYISAGPLVEKVFDPVVKDSTLAPMIEKTIGIGDGRGIGLLFMTLGVIWAISSILIYFNPRVRGLENEIPDALPNESGSRVEEILVSSH